MYLMRNRTYNSIQKKELGGKRKQLRAEKEKK